MSKLSKFLALVSCFISAAVSADQMPARGMLLVATDEERGPVFAQTVILLLQHDATGTLGLVVNRPIDTAAVEDLRQQADLAAYHGTFFWGGPVLPFTLRALLRSDTPRDDAMRIFDAIYLVNIDEALLADTSNAANLRLFVGYAGWGAGQLEYELALDSWHVLPATEKTVFTEDADDIWEKLVPPRRYQAGGELSDSGATGLYVFQALF
jgi:putative transcriptional regulator